MFQKFKNDSKVFYFLQKLTPGKVYDTRASLLRAHQIPVEGGPLWQLPRFSKHVSVFKRFPEGNMGIQGVAFGSSTKRCMCPIQMSDFNCLKVMLIVNSNFSSNLWIPHTTISLRSCKLMYLITIYHVCPSMV